MVTHINEGEIPAIHNKSDIPAHQPRAGITFQFFRSLHNIFAFVTVEPGAESNVHDHPWEQVVMAVEGETDFYFDGAEFPIKSGDIFFVPPTIEHGLRPRSDSRCGLFVTWPFREEYNDRIAYQREFEANPTS